MKRFDWNVAHVQTIMFAIFYLLVHEDASNRLHDGLSAAQLGAALRAPRLGARHSVLFGKHGVSLLPNLVSQAQVRLQPRTFAHGKLAKSDEAREKPKVANALHNVRRLKVLLEGGVGGSLVRLGTRKERDGPVHHCHLASSWLPLSRSKAWAVICTLRESKTMIWSVVL